MKILYTTKVEVKGGREGHARSSDGLLDIDLAKPKEFGGDGGRRGTNPEQLFAAGYAACFETALRAVAGKKGISIDKSSVSAVVSIGPRDAGGFGLKVELEVSLPGLPKAEAESLMQTAHDSVCPYSNAIRGNVEVDLKLV